MNRGGGRRLFVAVVLAVALPACGEDDGPSQIKAADRLTVLPCGREAETGPVGPDRIVPLGTFISASKEFRSVWLWNSRVAYTSERRAVVVCDLRTGETKTVDKVDKAEKYVLEVRAHGDRVVWTEFENNPRPDGATPWAIRVHDLRNDRTSTIAADRPRGQYFASPEPEVEGSTVVWIDLPPGDPSETGPELVAYDLATGTKRVLAGGNFPWSPQIVGGQVYFSAKADESRDLFVVPADGSSSPRRLTHEGGVDELNARNGWVTWIRFPIQHDPKETIGDLPAVALQIGSTETKVVAQAQSTVRAGHGFVIGYSVELGTNFVVGADGTDLRRFAVEGEIGVRGTSVDGDRVAWVTVDDPLGKRKPAYLRIGRVQR